MEEPQVTNNMLSVRYVSGVPIKKNDADDCSFKEYCLRHFTTVSYSSELKTLPPRLRKLSITRCDDLKSLRWGELENNLSIQKLYLINCHSLNSMHLDNLHTALETLDIENCRKLEFLSLVKKEYPYSVLEKLHLNDSCDSLTSFPLDQFPNLNTLIILGCLNFNSISITETQTSLSDLEIKHCPTLISFPEVGYLTPMLSTIILTSCKNLKALPNQLHSLASLQILYITECPELEIIPLEGFPSSLSTLNVKSCRKLPPCTQWKMHEMDALSFLGLEDVCVSLESFPEENLLPNSLKSLSISKLPNLEFLNCNGFQKLEALTTLGINCCNKLQALPDKGFPGSLEYLYVNDCPLLEPKLQNTLDNFIHWYKIARIPNVRIGSRLS